MSTFRGGCHCGVITVELETNLRPDELPRRACQCSFCRKHAAISTSDPHGALRVIVGDPGRVSRYQFGLRTAEFLVCGVCGVYVAAVMTRDGASWAVVNANTLDVTLTGAVQPLEYDGENAEERIARRTAKWMPATLR